MARRRYKNFVVNNCVNGVPPRHEQAVAIIASFCLAYQPVFALANPQGGTVSGGSATINQSGSTVTINQSSNKSIIDWNSFNIGSGETTIFNQPGSSSIALNRIHDMNASQILGTLDANGHVILVNPNGVFFGKGSTVDVSGLIATTANINNSDFMNGRMNFNQPGNPNASIINNGSITAGNAGLVGFIAPQVVNNGTITAKLGTVALASGDTFTLDMAGDNLISVAVSGAVNKELAANAGTIQADGGTVTLTAAAARSVVDSLVSNSGVVQADSIESVNGHILLAAGSNGGASQATNSGTLSASGKASGQTGGDITVTGDNVDLAPTSVIDASGDAGGGNVKVGGDFHGAGSTQTAQNTTVEQGSTIDASAITSGNGGNVAVWSNNNTVFAGSITANGGATSGNGGYVETSGHNLLATGSVSAGATRGNAGTWLLDPNNIDIEQASCTGTSCASANTIGTSLSGGTNVTITTTTGSITLGGTATATITDSNGAATLDFEAGTDIVMSHSSAITASGTGNLGVTFDADTALGGGAISLGSGSSITTQGGNIIMGGQGTPAGKAAVGDITYTAGINVNATTLSAGGGSITLNGQGYAGTTNDYGVELQSTAKLSTTGGGTISITGTGGNGTTGDAGIYMTGVNTQTISAVNGAITLVGKGAGSSTGGYGIDIVGGATSPLITTTGNNNGTITLTGTVGGTSTVGILTSDTTAADVIESSGNVTLSSNEDISLTKTNINYTGSNAINVELDSNMNGGGVGADYINTSNITTNGGNITIAGGTNPGGLVNGSLPATAAYGSASNTNGIYVASSQLKAGGGTITLDGTGYGTTTGHYGVYLTGALLQTSGSGTISITGSAAGTSGYGVGIVTNSLIENLGSSGITITGNSTGINNAITFTNGSVADAIHANGGTVTVTGNTDIVFTDSAITSPGSDPFNVVFDADTSGTGGSIILSHSNVTTYGGNITMGGGANPLTGVADAWHYGDGVQISNTTVNAGGGNIVMNGEGLANSNVGNLCGIETDGTTVIETSGSGNITLYGIAGIGTGPGQGNYNYGVAIRSAGSSTGIFTGNGNISITALYHPGSTEYYSQPYLQDGGAIVGATGSGNLTITAIGSPYVIADMYLGAAPTNQFGTSTMTGNITLNINSTEIGTLNILTAGSLIIAPRTSGTSLGVLGGAGTLNIGHFAGDQGTGLTINAANTIIGNASSGDITVNGGNWNGNLTLLSAGSITIAGNTTMGSHSFTADTSGNIILDGSISSSATGNAITLIDGNAFINEAGPGALNVPDGRWLIYSTNPGMDKLDGLSSDLNRFNCTYGNACQSLSSTGDGVVYSITLPPFVESMNIQPVQPPTFNTVSVNDMIYIDSGLLQSLGYNQSDPHPWWDAVIQPNKDSELSWNMHTAH